MGVAHLRMSFTARHVARYHLRFTTVHATESESKAMSAMSVRVRYAPSPTGYLHLGGARTALFNYLYARHCGGSFILRIEDTDRSRYEASSLTDLLSGLRWLGLDWDEGPDVGGDFGPYVQSQRLDLYRSYAEQLIRGDEAYRCYCSVERLAQVREDRTVEGLSPSYDRHCRSLTREQIAHCEAQGIQPVVRLKAPLEGKTDFDDVIHGHIVVNNSQLDDLVLLKSDRYPTYHLAVVVDDYSMRISHVLRGDEWLTSTPSRVIIYRAFGWEPPVYCHLPTILDPSGKGKLSKRKKRGPEDQEYATYVHEFEQLGYLPEALFNFLARVGWSYDDKTELFERAELIRDFDLPGVSKSSAVFSYEKLDWMNGVYIRNLSQEDLALRLLPVLREAGLDTNLQETRRLAPLVQERLKRLSDAPHLVGFLFSEATYDPALLIQKRMDSASTLDALDASHTLLAGLSSFDEETLERNLRSLADRLGLKPRQLFGAIRVAVTGRQVSPPLFGTLSVLGQPAAVQRLAKAKGLLAGEGRMVS